jgi:hypothetical protein
VVVEPNRTFFEELFMMKPILICTAVLSLMTFSSCGKSKDTKKADETATKQTQTAPSAPEQNGAPVPASADGGLNNPANAPLPAAPTGRPADRTGSGATTGGSTTGAPTNGGIGPAPTGHANGTPVIDGNSDAETQTNNSSVLRPPLSGSTKESSAVDLQFDEAEAVKTGGKSQTMSFTSAGSDGLMAEFRSYAKKVNPEQQKMNQNLAAAVVSAKVRRVSTTGEVFVDLNVDEFGKLVTYKMKASDEGDKMNLSLASSTGGDLEFQGGFLKCTDLDGGCENAYVKIKLSGAYTRIIFRNSYADYHYGVYTNSNGVVNSNFELWKTYIQNKVSGAATTEKMDFVQVSSYEVVNGKAGMGALLMTQDQDMVGLSIPLVAGEKGTKVSAVVTKLSDISKSYDLSVLASQYTQKLSQAVKSVTLIANNGLGQVRMLLSFSENKTDSKIFLTLSRVQKSTMSVEDVQKFEATLKAF